ncbi:MAG: membrane protein insertase YidC [Candidatus Riflebacteria bacterium]|nr:membrane protein insertase YidC [Candidatus Riflebacteria bacterium]
MKKGLQMKRDWRSPLLAMSGWLLLLTGLALAVAGPAGSDSLKTFETSLYTAKIDPNGNVVSFLAKVFQDDLLKNGFVQKEKPLPKMGGFLVGPMGHLSTDARLVTTMTAKGTFVSRDPTGNWLPKELEIERQYRFVDGSYAFEVELTLRNTASRTIPLSATLGETAVWLGPALPSSSYASFEVVGATPQAGLESLSLKDEVKATAPGLKWIGCRENYYCSVLQERQGRGHYLYANVAFEEADKTQYNAVLLGFRYQYAELRSKEEANLSFRIYLGPKLEHDLAAAGYAAMFNNWDGLTGSIGKMMFQMLQVFHRITGSYGISILLLTLLVKVVLHPLNIKQLRSMQKLQELQPKLQELQKKYSDKRELQTEMQKLYVQHNVNPLGGCFPIVLQIPIFIALYSCLMGAIELKKVRFLWLPDLAKPDPLALLPILFAGSIYLSSKMSSSPQMDKSQQTVMQIMPIMMLVLMVNVPSGVMLYLAGQSVLSIAETRVNQRAVEAEKAAAMMNKGKRRGKKSETTAPKSSTEE